jgi:type IV secretory pathway component VirB8
MKSKDKQEKEDSTPFILASPEESRRFIQAILILFSILMMMFAIAIFIPFT